MKPDIDVIIQKIQSLPELIEDGACIGFDAVVDELVRPVEAVGPDMEKDYFKTIGEFGRFVAGKSHLSCLVELANIMAKPGGNMVNLSAALGRLGMVVDCVGTMGYPEVSPVFSGMENCRLHSVADHGKCTALEFMDGKVMLAQMGDAADLEFEAVVQALGEVKLQALFGQAATVGLVNWSEMTYSNNIWQGVLELAVKPAGSDFNKLVLVDITDCSRHNAEHVQAMGDILKDYALYRRVVVSLNQNEAVLLRQFLNIATEEEDLPRLAEAIAQKLGVQGVVIHPVSGSVAWVEGNTYTHEGFFVEHPVISTGGGDNYNAGLLLGLRGGLNMTEVLAVAGAVGSFYVEKGHSPTREQLCSYLAAKGGKHGETVCTA